MTQIINWQKFNTNKKDFEKIEREVLGILIQKSTDISNSINILLKTKENHLKSHACLLMTMIDIFSRLELFFYKTNTEEKENKKRFKNWLDKYLFTKSNSDYKNNQVNISYNSEDLYSVRNALLHFYGTPSKNKLGISFGYDYGHITNTQRKEFLEKKIKIIDFKFLDKAIKEGVTNQIQSLGKILTNEPENYIEIILKTFEVIKWEGTMEVDLSKK